MKKNTTEWLESSCLLCDYMIPIDLQPFYSGFVCFDNRSQHWLDIMFCAHSYRMNFTVSQFSGENSQELVFVCICIYATSVINDLLAIFLVNIFARKKVNIPHQWWLLAQMEHNNLDHDNTTFFYMLLIRIFDFKNVRWIKHISSSDLCASE